MTYDSLLMNLLQQLDVHIQAKNKGLFSVKSNFESHLMAKVFLKAIWTVS